MSSVSLMLHVLLFEGSLLVPKAVSGACLCTVSVTVDNNVFA